MPEPIYEPEFDFNAPDPQDTKLQKFWAYHRKHPDIYRAIEARALAISGRISTKRIYEELRGKFPHLNNTFTSDYADLLCEKHPELAPRIERRNRAKSKMALHYVK